MMPRFVILTIGTTAYMVVAIRAGVFPGLKSITAGTRYTKAGIVCIRSRIGLTTADVLLLIATIIPSGNPIMTERKTATITMLIVSSMFSHRPHMPIKKSIAAYIGPT